MSLLSRRWLLAVPLPLVALLGGCIGPDKEQQAWASDLERRLSEVPGVAEATVNLRANLGEAVTASPTVVGIADRPVAEVAETAGAASAVIAEAGVPPRMKPLFSRLQQADRDRQLTVRLDDGESASRQRTRDGFAELDRGAVEVTAADDLTSSWPAPDPAMLQSVSGPKVIRQANDRSVMVYLNPGDDLTGQPLVEVVGALEPATEQVDLRRSQGTVLWMVRAHRDEADEPGLASAVEDALRILLRSAAAAGGCRVEIGSPWWVVLAVDSRVEVERWKSESNREIVEPILTSLLARVNR